MYYIILMAMSCSEHFGNFSFLFHQKSLFGMSANVKALKWMNSYLYSFPFCCSIGIPPTPTSASKKNSSRRNAWGNLSYADLITKAISSSTDNRLTLSQIYEWMVQNVPYFKDKGDSNSSAGWKVSKLYFFRQTM